MFSDGNTNRAWWERPLKTGYGHVDTVIQSPVEGILIQSYAGHLDIQVLEPWMAEKLVFNWPGMAIRFQPDLEFQRPRRWPFGPRTCVTLAKILVGCNNRLVLTPWQLHKWALDNGGRLVGSEEAEENGCPAGARSAPIAAAAGE